MLLELILRVAGDGTHVAAHELLGARDARRVERRREDDEITGSRQLAKEAVTIARRDVLERVARHDGVDGAVSDRQSRAVTDDTGRARRARRRSTRGRRSPARDRHRRSAAIRSCHRRRARSAGPAPRFARTARTIAPYRAYRSNDVHVASGNSIAARSLRGGAGRWFNRGTRSRDRGSTAGSLRSSRRRRAGRRTRIEHSGAAPEPKRGPDGPLLPSGAVTDGGAAGDSPSCKGSNEVTEGETAEHRLATAVAYAVAVGGARSSRVDRVHRGVAGPTWWTRSMRTRPST